MLPSPKILKYRLNALIEQRRGNTGQSKGTVIQEICQLLELTPSMVWRYRAAREGETMALSSDQLILLADYFGCSIDDILNKVPNEAATA